MEFEEHLEDFYNSSAAAQMASEYSAVIRKSAQIAHESETALKYAELERKYYVLESKLAAITRTLKEVLYLLEQ